MGELSHRRIGGGGVNLGEMIWTKFLDGSYATRTLMLNDDMLNMLILCGNGGSTISVYNTAGTNLGDDFMSQCRDDTLGSSYGMVCAFYITKEGTNSYSIRNPRTGAAYVSGASYLYGDLYYAAGYKMK